MRLDGRSPATDMARAAMLKNADRAFAHHGVESPSLGEVIDRERLEAGGDFPSRRRPSLRVLRLRHQLKAGGPLREGGGVRSLQLASAFVAGPGPLHQSQSLRQDENHG